jgi:hypothetical protein
MESKCAFKDTIGHVCGGETRWYRLENMDGDILCSGHIFSKCEVAISQSDSNFIRVFLNQEEAISMMIINE